MRSRLDAAFLLPGTGSLYLSQIEGSPPASEAVEVRLLSPARLIQDGRLLPGGDPVPFPLLIARILDRIQGVFGAAAANLITGTARAGLEAAAAEVPMLQDETRWIEVRDYSARSRSEMLLGGKIGRVVYGNGAAQLLPLLRAGEIIQIGKNVASGCGRIEVRLNTADK